MHGHAHSASINSKQRTHTLTHEQTAKLTISHNPARAVMQLLCSPCAFETIVRKQFLGMACVRNRGNNCMPLKRSAHNTLSAVADVCGRMAEVSDDRMAEVLLGANSRVTGHGALSPCGQRDNVACMCAGARRHIQRECRIDSAEHATAFALGPKCNLASHTRSRTRTSRITFRSGTNVTVAYTLCAIAVHVTIALQTQNPHHGHETVYVYQSLISNEL